MNIASPRLGSPPVAAAAWMRMLLRCSAYSMTIPMRATTNRIAASAPKTSLVEGDCMRSLRCFQPFVEHHQRGDAVHQAARDPHHQPRKLLVGDRVEPDPGHPHCGII